MDLCQLRLHLRIRRSTDRMPRMLTPPLLLCHQSGKLLINRNCSFCKGQFFIEEHRKSVHKKSGYRSFHQSWRARIRIFYFIFWFYFLSLLISARISRTSFISLSCFSIFRFCLSICSFCCDTTFLSVRISLAISVLEVLIFTFCFYTKSERAVLYFLK